MSNARIQFSLASEDVWNAYNPQLKEGEIVTVLKANKKVKLVQGKVGGSTYSESTVIWDQDTAETIMSRSELAESTATAQAAAASGSASKAAASQSAAATSAANAKASENAAKTSETNAKASETAAKNSATSAASSASTASMQAGKAADSATAAAGSATQAGTFATTATNQATAAAKSESNAKAYMDTTKDLSENVNVFVPTVDADGTLTWTNKAGLSNPDAVNIKGVKGDKGDTGEQGLQGVKGDTGEQGLQGIAATIRIGSVYTGEPGTNASVTNSGTASNVVLNFTLPRGKDGADGGVTVDAELSDTSTNPVQNKAIYNALLNKVGTDIFSGFALMGATSTIAWRQGSQAIGSINATNYTGTAARATQDGAGNVITETYATKADINGVVKTVNNTAPDENGNVTIAVSSGDGVSTSESNTWTAQQNFHDLMLSREKYTTYVVNGTSDTPITSTMVYAVTSAFTLDLSVLAGALSASQSSVFTAYFAANADYSLTISNAGKLKYVGSASDVAITSAGLLLNIWMSKDGGGTLTSIVQANKLEGGA